MVQKNNIRKNPGISFLATMCNFIAGRMDFSKVYLGKAIRTKDGQKFTVFRHLVLKSNKCFPGEQPVVFIVRFKFERLSQKANRLASLIPIPLIAGFPGFREKIWMVNNETGFWQGVYQWESQESVEEYKRSFVLGVMNRRAKKDTLEYSILTNTTLSCYMREHLEEKEDL